MAFNGRFVLNMVHFAAKQGADFDEMIAISNRTAQELGAASCRVENEVYNRLLEYAVATTKDDFFGLHFGESSSLTAAGLIAQITQTSETVKQALEYCCHFANLGCSVLPMQLEEMPHHYRLTLSPNPIWGLQSAVAVRHTVEGNLAFALKEFQNLTHQKYKPIAIHLGWPAPTDTSEYERVFACSIDYNKGEVAIYLHKQQVEAKVITSDYNLLRVLVAHAEEKSAQLEKEKGYAAVVKNAILSLSQTDFPSVEQIASHLNLSIRTLQRYLKADGYTYKQLLDELRKDLAVSYLKRPDLNIGEVAYLLNYADNSTFSRSFKRWTGQTPQQYRAKVSSSDHV